MPVQDRRRRSGSRDAGPASTADSDGSAPPAQGRGSVHVLHLPLPTQRFDQLCSIADDLNTLAMDLATDWVVERLREYDEMFPASPHTHDPENPSDLQVASVRQLPVFAGPDEVDAGWSPAPVTFLVAPETAERVDTPQRARRRSRARSG